MTLERTRPLPPGRYWAIVRPRNLVTFLAWLAVARTRGAAVEVTSHRDDTTDGEAFDFFIWHTTTEMIWPDVDMGFAPNIAGPDVQSYEDTVQRPPPPTGAEALGLDGLASTGKTVLIVGGVVVVAALVAAVVMSTRRISRRR